MARLSIRFVGPMTSGGVRARRSARRVDLRGQRVRRHDSVDEPDPLRLGGIDEVAGQQQLPGPLLADEERHQQRHRRRPVADLRLAELGALGRDDEVAGHRELEAAGQRIAVDLGDDRLGRIEEPQRGRDVGRQQLAPGDRAADRALGLLGQVVAGREGPAGALEDDDPDAGVGFGCVEGGHERCDQRAVEGVELRRAVQREPDAPRRPLGQEDGLVRHRSRRRPRGVARRARPARRPRARPGRGDDRVQVDLDDVRPRVAEPRQRDDQVGDGTAIDRRAAADAVEEPRAAQLVEHRERRLAIDRREADRHVVEHLGEHAAEPDDDRRRRTTRRGGARR